MIEKMLKFVMMVAIWLSLFWIIKIFTILEWIQKAEDENRQLITELQYNLEWLDIECVKDF